MKASLKLLLTANLLAILLTGCGAKEEAKKEENHDEHSDFVKLADESIRQIELETVEAALQPLTGYLTIPAKVITNQDNEAHIGSLVQGRVHQVSVKVGDYVTAGQTLMTVEGLDIGKIKADFLIARAAHEYTRANYERQKKLFDEKIGSQKALLESQSEYEKALAEYKAEDKKIHSVGLSDEDVTDIKPGEDHTPGTLPIKSSISGIVVERNVVIGQLVDAATTSFKVINTNTLWVDGQIYEKDLGRINKKTNALFTSAAYPGENFKGKIIYIGQTVDEHSRTITIRGEFSNSDYKLKPQMFGELKIPAGADALAIMVPEESVVKENGQEYVFVRTSKNIFEPRTVITGTNNNNLVEITEGIKTGEKVVSKGVFYLKSELKKEEIAGDEH